MVGHRGYILLDPCCHNHIWAIYEGCEFYPYASTKFDLCRYRDFNNWNYHEREDSCLYATSGFLHCHIYTIGFEPTECFRNIMASILWNGFRIHDDYSGTYY